MNPSPESDPRAPASPGTPAPPGPEEQFDIGSTADSIDRMGECYARYGDLYRVYAPGRKSYTYVVNDPEDVKRILLSNHRNYTKGIGLDRVKILLGNGIMVSEGDFWRSQRYMMQPMFHRRVIERFIGMIAEANESLLARWHAKADAGEPVDVTEEMSQLTLEIVLKSILGSDLARLARSSGGNPFEVVTREQERDLKFAYKFRQLTKLVAEVVKQRRAESRDEFDFLGMLMNARDKETGAPMGERALIDEVMTLVVAGHETTASGLNWTWYLLSQHPEVEARLHAELDAARDIGDRRFNALDQLPCTQQVIEEALRLYPPGWLLSRRTIEADRLGGFHIAPKTDILISPYFLHRNVKHWEEPEAFRPERFAPDAVEARHRFAYIPFAVGPRHCIGENFALFEMVMHLYEVARQFRLHFEPAGPLEVEAAINLRTRKNLFMTLERRQQRHA
ncbi:MAG: cytochrome P450 [Steroidobacterales bacterium]